MSSHTQSGFWSVAKAAALFTLATACFGLLAENFAVWMNNGLLSRLATGWRVLIGLGAFALFTMLFWKADGIALLFRRKNSPEVGQRDSVKAWLALGAFTAMAAAHGLLGINFAHALDDSWHLHGWTAVAFAAPVFFAITLIFWTLRNQLAGIFAVKHHRSAGIEIVEQDAPRYAGVLSILSDNRSDPEDYAACTAARTLFDETLATQGDWSAAIRAVNDDKFPKGHPLNFWNGQQFLRSLTNLIVNFDRKRPLRLVTMICTEESARRFPAYSDLVKHIIQKHPDEKVRAVDIRMADELLKSGGDWEANKLAMQSALEALAQDALCRSGKVCVEITGGSSDLSIVGAVATISKSSNFRYVFTNPDYNAHNFDLQSRDTPME